MFPKIFVCNQHWLSSWMSEVLMKRIGWFFQLHPFTANGVIIYIENYTTIWHVPECWKGDSDVCFNDFAVVMPSLFTTQTTSVTWNQQFSFKIFQLLNGPRQAYLVLIAYVSSEGSGEPAHPRSLARTSAPRSYKQWVKRNLQTESQITGPSECLGMCS